MRKKQKPTCFVIAGPNGAGKTTFALRYLPQIAGCRNFINADLIAYGLSPFDSLSAQYEAGRLFLRVVHANIEKRVGELLYFSYGFRMRLFQKAGYANGLRMAGMTFLTTQSIVVILVSCIICLKYMLLCVIRLFVMIIPGLNSIRFLNRPAKRSELLINHYMI
jgi:hypothetical protein